MEEESRKEMIRIKIEMLKNRLSSQFSDVGDWKIIKCYEYKLMEQEPPYDVERLNEERQTIRDEINRLEGELKEEEEMVL